MPIIPEGGIPSRLVMHPLNGPSLVICAEGPEVAVFRREDWDTLGMEAVPLAYLTRDEVNALTGFVRYWRGTEIEGFDFTTPGPSITFEDYRT